jgi:hypothetical protein
MVGRSLVINYRFSRHARLLTRAPNKAKRNSDIDCIPTLPIPSNHLKLPKTSLGLPLVRHEPVSLYMSCVNAVCSSRLWFDTELNISTFREFSKRGSASVRVGIFPGFGARRGNG